MSSASASVILAVLMIGLAIYFVFVPPPGFGEHMLHRITIPFLLVAGAFGVLENLRTRAHMGQLVGALRSLIGRRGQTAGPEVRAEAIEILLKSLRSEQESVRVTAGRQLRQLTGQAFGDEPEEWERWWAEHAREFKGNQA